MKSMNREETSCVGTLISKENASICTAYFTFLLCASVVMRKFSDRDFSVVLTAGAAVQFLGFFLLHLKVKNHKSVAGISSKTLEVYVLVICFRLSSTLFKNGYLPVDRSGDFVYQFADIASLWMVLQLLYCVHKTHRVTYLAEHDTLNIWRTVFPCIILAMFFHGNMNRSPIFDTMWMVGMNLDTIAVIPQLWMMTKAGGEVDGMTSHFVASIAVSRGLSFSFWYYGYKEMAPKNGGPNVAGWMVIVAHAIQLLASADFMFHYARASLAGSRMVLPGAGSVEA